MQALQWLWDHLGAWAAAYRPELFCVVPLALLVLFGFCSTPWWAYAVVLIAMALTVLLCNPFHVWDRLLPPKTRLLMAAGVLIGLLPVSFYGVAPLAKLILLALAVGLWAVALWRRKLWLGLYLVQQSAEVNTVLSHLSHAGDWEAGRAWERYGCRETRALLHQTLYAVCDENEMQRTYMPVYLLGYLHGRKEAASQEKKAETEQATLDRQARLIQNQEEELESLKADNAFLEGQLAQAQNSAHSYQSKATLLERRLEETHLAPEERDAAILDYVEQGHSYADAGKKYGLSKSGALNAAKRARAAKEKDPSCS
ncbi:MAG: hypothetical protein LIO70_09175 [Clostridiales bacterium]|nr:hypothetical protein [Clostridiales bacterium]